MEQVRFADEVVIDAALATAGLATLDVVRRRSRRESAPAAIVDYLAGGLRQAAASPAVTVRGCIVLDKETALDLAAGLLVAADGLHASGRHLEAFSLEGLQSRVMEAALGPP